jgi:hypothetical protein
MASVDLVAMLGNLSRSLSSVQRLAEGMAYMIGILFVITALFKFKIIANTRTGGSSQEKMYVPVMFFFGGTALLFLPSMTKVLSNTAFGAGNILQYIQVNPYDIYSSMGVLIQTAGIIWFIRGCILIVHGSEPGTKHSTKGLAFIGAGVLSMNFTYCVAAANYIMTQFLSFTGMGH